MLIGIIVFISLSLLILIHEAGHFFVARWFGMKVDEFGFGFPPRLKAWRRGSMEYSVNWLPFGGFVRIAGENDRITEEGQEKLARATEDEKRSLFIFQSAWKRAVVLLAGVFLNFVIGWWLLVAVFMIGTSDASLVVTGVQSSSPGATVGFQAGDVLVGYVRADDFISFVDAHRGQPTAIAIQREGQGLSLTVTPRTERKPGEGAIGILLGEVGVARQAPLVAIWTGLQEAGLLFWQTILAFGTLLQSIFLHAKIPEGVAGPVGIFVVAQASSKFGWIYLVHILALISINLCVLNLIPFPALDGGRVFLILLEKLKGSPIPIKTEAILNGVGFIFLIMLIIGITFHDVWGLVHPL